jgi:limonene-1,2-epoxide hydrolase
MSEAQQVVQAFCDAMVERDVDAVRPLLAEDASYQNTGMPPVRGLEAILENLGGQFAMFPDSYEYRTLNIATSGNVVLTERLDMIRTPGGLQGVPVMGAFVVRDGKISRWTDYWDTALPAKMMGGEDVSALVPETY